MAEKRTKYKNLSPHQQAKFKRVMREFAAGTLRSSSGEKVTSRSQAVAIAYSEAGKAK